MMLITRTSIITGKTHTRALSVTPEQLKQWDAGSLIQNVFPHLTAGQREWLMTGITPREWNEELGPEDET